MRRVLFITILCFGVLLIGLTATLLVQRRGGLESEVVLLNVTQNGKMHLMAVTRQGQRDFWRRLGPPSESLFYWTASPDGQWLYVERYQANTGSTFVRVNANTLRYETLPHQISPYVWTWSSDSQWMVFDSKDSRGRTTIFRATPDGKHLQDLTPHFDAAINPVYPVTPVIIAGEDWVVIDGFGKEAEIYRVDIASGQMIQLSRWTTPSYLRGYVQNATGDWLIIEKPDGPYRMRLDGSQLTPLLPQEPSLSTWREFWPAARLMLFEFYLNSDHLYGVSIDDFSVRWVLPRFFVPLISPSAKHLLAQNADGWVYTIAPDGSTTRVVEIFTNGPTYELSPDERWVVVSVADSIFLVNLANGQRRDLYIGTGHLSFLEWADDGESFYIAEDDGTSMTLWRMWLADGHKQCLVEKTTGLYMGIGHLREPAFHGLALVGMGGGLILGAWIGIKPRQISGKHRSSTS